MTTNGPTTLPGTTARSAGRSRVPPVSLHEAMIWRHLAVDPVSRQPLRDEAIEGLHSAMSHGRAAAEHARRIADAVLGNEMQTLPARHRRTREECWRVTKPALERFDAALGVARAEVAAVERRIAAPPAPRDAMSTLLAGEIRARLASMTREARRKVLAEELTAGTADTLHAAVLGAPAMLSGLTSVELEVQRANWQRARHADDLDRVRRLGAALEDAERGGSLLIDYSNGLSSAAIVESAEASEQKAREAIAG